MRRKTMLFIYIASVLSTLFLITGFVLGVKEIILPQIHFTKPVASTEKIALSKEGLLLGLGDSLTRGIGDSSGQGYLGRVKQKIVATNHAPLSFINLAINGATSIQLVKQLQDARTQNLIKQAKWITFTIGGNDLFRGSGQLEEIDIAASEKSLVLYRKNVTSILTDIRKLNPKATVILVGLYNPFTGMQDEKNTSHLVTKWNSATGEIASHFTKVIVVPTFDLFQMNTKQYLSSDNFHPNDVGYQRVADRVFQIMNE
jgi:lysophospholipase L1-like esterase